ncbi:MAG TPA: trypsin-like peptidase domain-containing protein [Ktedonobacterales bacterium]
MSDSIPAMSGGTAEPSGPGPSAPPATSRAPLNTSSGSPAAPGLPSQTQRPPVAAPPEQKGLLQSHPVLAVIGALAIIVVAIGVAFAVGRAAASSDLQQSTINTISTVDPSVVQVQGSSSGKVGGSIGSGEILTTSGYIVTNSHVVHGFSSFEVLLSTGQKVSARLVADVPSQDLAVLKISASDLKPIAVADSSQVQVGQFDIAMGSPLGLEQSATSGIVSALDREGREVVDGKSYTLTGMIQTSAPINPGNSGGALVNLQGELIGIPTLSAVDPSTGVAANGIGYAISSNKMKQVIAPYIPAGG